MCVCTSHSELSLGQTFVNLVSSRSVYELCEKWHKLYFLVSEKLAVHYHYQQKQRGSGSTANTQRNNEAKMGMECIAVPNERTNENLERTNSYMRLCGKAEQTKWRRRGKRTTSAARTLGALISQLHRCFRSLAVCSAHCTCISS